jgi:hypothetical protein
LKEEALGSTCEKEVLVSNKDAAIIVFFMGNYYLK